MGQVYQCWWRIYREIKVFSRFECFMFYVLYELMTYLVSLSSTMFKAQDLSCYNGGKHVHLCFFPKFVRL
jgi:hypothetical protein